MAKTTDKEKYIAEIAELKSQLFEATSMVEAIKNGEVDALILNTNGKANIYAMESADYTYRILIEKFSESALSIAENGLILFCNTAFSKLVGIETDKLIGTYFNSFIDSVGQFHTLKEELKKGISKGEIVLNINGSKVPVMMSITDLNPQVNALGIIISDLALKIKYEETIALYEKKLALKNNELFTSNEYLEQFMHVVSQNVKEPLRKIAALSSQVNGVSGHAELSHLNNIHSSATRLTDLIDDLTNYTLSDGKIVFKDEDLNILLNEVSENLEVLLKEQKVELQHKDLPHVIGSKVQIRQVFENIISYSIAHRKMEGKHIVKFENEITDCVDINFPNKKYYRITIRDNGNGIKPAQLKNIFAFSHHLQPKINENNGDNNIGLAISKKIMENHHGKIEALSLGNSGTVYKVYFPVKY